MIKKSLLILLMSSAVYAVDTTTTTSFTTVNPTLGSDGSYRDGIYQNGNSFYDKHGNVVLHQRVEIKTENFKVNNFWNKFSYSGNGQSEVEFDTITKSGIVRTTVEASSLCNLYSELDSQGCSGQKPFLINDEAITQANTNADGNITLIFQKDYDGSSILFENTNNSSFYPLDINRDEKYYKHQEGDSGCKSFFCVMTGMFDGFFGVSFFSSFFDFDVSNSSGTDVDDVRERYIANITAGLDQNHLMQIGNDIDKEVIELNTHSPISFIDYVENMSDGGTCNLGFMTFGDNSIFCNFMSGMPFISAFASTTPEQTYNIDTIQVDTENSIISFAGAYSDINVTEYETSSTLSTDTSSSLPLPLEIMKNMMCMFMPFISCDEDTVTTEISRVKDSYYTFDEENATTLTMAITDDGDTVDSFQTFKLLGIHSIVGDGSTTTTCEVEKTHKETSCIFMFCSTSTVRDWLNIYSEENTDSPDPIADEGFSTTSPTWYNWCESNSAPITVDVVTGESCDWFGNCTDTSTEYTYTNTGVAGVTNDSGRILSLDLQIVELNATSSSANLRYNLLGTN